MEEIGEKLFGVTSEQKRCFAKEQKCWWMNDVLDYVVVFTRQCLK